MKAFRHLITCLLASTITAVLATTVSTVESDLVQITSNLTSFDTALRAFPVTGGTLVQALRVHSTALSTITSLETGVADVKALPPSSVSPTDLASFKTSVEAMLPTALDICHVLIADEANGAFGSLPIGGIGALIKQDMKSFFDSFDSFLEAFETISADFTVFRNEFASCAFSIVLPLPV